MENKGKRALTVLLFLCVILVGVAKEASAATLSVTTQPKSATVIVGETASFTVVVSGTGLKYQWQAQAPGTTVWKNSSAASAKTATLKITALAAHNNYKFRCVVTDNSGKTVTSNAATLTVKPMISVQPKSTSTTVGGTATFSITTAISSGVSFQWQAKAPNADSWKNSGATGARTTSMKITAQAAHNGYQFRCVVKDCKGNEYISNAATLTIMPKITAQPKSINVAVGSAAGFSVTVTGKAPLSYQWQSKAPGSDTWKNSVAASAKTNRFSFKVQTAHNGYQFRCVITDSNGRKVTTDAATLTVKPGLTTQPKNASLAEKTTVTFSVTAVGNGTLKYQWQSKSPGSDTWKNSLAASAKTNTFSFTVQKGHQGYLFRCIVTDGNGNKSVSNTARLTLCNIPVNTRFFPDNQLLGNAKYNYDSDRNGVLDSNELSAVKTINGILISDYSGIEFFTNLQELHVYAAHDDIDFSCNTELISATIEVPGKPIYDYATQQSIEDSNEYHISFHDNKKLQNLSCSGRIGSLDISNCSQLTQLACNSSLLASLDLSNCGNLTNLDCSNCTKLSALDFSKCSKLIELNCSGTGISSIDLSKCGQLLRVNVSATKLTKLNVSGCKQLRELNCSSCKLNQLTLGELVALQELNCSNNALTTVELYGCTNLFELFCQNNAIADLSVSNCAKIERMNCSQNLLSGLYLANNTELTDLNCEGNYLTSLNVSYLNKLKTLDCSYNKLIQLTTSSKNGSYTASRARHLESVKCNNNQLNSLTIESVWLESLDCSNNRLSTLSYSTGTLEDLNCSNNQLQSIDGGKAWLKSLNCSNNLLSELELRDSTRLSSLQCKDNNITVLDISKTKLKDSTLSVDEGVIILR